MLGRIPSCRILESLVEFGGVIASRPDSHMALHGRARAMAKPLLESVLVMLLVEAVAKRMAAISAHNVSAGLVRVDAKGSVETKLTFTQWVQQALTQSQCNADRWIKLVLLCPNASVGVY